MNDDVEKQNNETGGREKGQTGLIVYSSKTGNTRKIAEGIHRGLCRPADASQGIVPSIRLAAVEENPAPSGADWLLIGFWVDRGDGDQKTLQYLDSLEGCRIGLFGTLGAYPNSAYARDICQRVQDAAAKKNTVLGCFLCQGRIDPALTEKFKNLPPDNPYAMNEERMKQYEDAAKHPDEGDIEAAVAACRSMISTAFLGMEH
ncbi:MAG: flavodoxin family protein [Spirochaetaceae bacterium]|jgi:menaquinone-dependent protoporphyrinogen IX oxidase|nr:flavodoxin family protein [Spirochaetaceae bacterium]